MRIKVLWIDDQPNAAFIDKADMHRCDMCADGIEIENFDNVDAGIDELKLRQHAYEAIILDANCISHKDGSNAPDISALSYALQNITRHGVTLPWFVYSAGGFDGENAIDITVRGYERCYDDKSWYKKPSEMTCLFNKIVEVVSKKPLYTMKQKYPEIFEFYPDKESLIQILLFLEEKKYNNPDVFNKIRKELEWVFAYCYTCGISQLECNATNLSDCSRFLGQNSLQGLVPIHIQRSIHSVSSICNNGSHQLEIDKLVRTNKAPYLVYSTIMEFLNILYWLPDLPISPEDRDKLKSEVAALVTAKDDDKAKYEGKVFVVEQDERQNYHCGQCRLPYNLAPPYYQKKVVLYDVRDNNAKSKDNYLYFASFRPLEDTDK